MSEGRRAVARAIRDVARARGEGGASMHRAIVSSTNPLRIDMVGLALTLNADEFNLSQWVRHYDHVYKLRVGDALWMVEDQSEWSAVDVETNRAKPKQRKIKQPTGGQVKDPRARAVIRELRQSLAEQGVIDLPDDPDPPTEADDDYGDAVGTGGGSGGPPSGPAGGVLAGTYPNPGFAADMATQAELDAHANATTAAHGGIVASTDPRLTDARPPTTHGHPQADITDLEADLASKSDVGHTHAVSDLLISGTPDGTKFLRDDDTWAVVAAGGGAADSPIIQRVTAQSSFTISGLDGNADEIYEILLVGSVAGAGSGTILVRPNGISTSAQFPAVGSAAYAGTTDMLQLQNVESGTTGMMFGPAVDLGPGVVDARGTLFAKTGQRRMLIYSDGSQMTGYIGGYSGASQWTDTTTNITSLTFATLGGGTFTGLVMLRKLLAPTTLLAGPRIIRGQVNANGTIAQGQGFTVTKLGLGYYRVNFTTPFAAPPAVAATPSLGGTWVMGEFSDGTQPTASSFDFQIARHDAAVSIDANFNFVAVDTSGAGVNSWSAPQRVDTLPASGVNEQEIYFRPDPLGNPGVMWNLRRDATAAKWDNAGSTPLYLTDAVTVQTTTTTEHQIGTLAFTLPAAGLYQVELIVNGDTAGTENLTLWPGGTGITRPKGSAVWIRDPNTESHSHTFEISADIAGRVLQVRGQASGGNIRTLFRGLKIIPIRIG